MQLIEQLDFMEVEKVNKKKSTARYDFFNL
jgi:hypothetical protein